MNQVEGLRRSHTVLVWTALVLGALLVACILALWVGWVHYSDKRALRTMDRLRCEEAGGTDYAKLDKPMKCILPRVRMQK